MNQTIELANSEIHPIHSFTYNVLGFHNLLCKKLKQINNRARKTTTQEFSVERIYSKDGVTVQLLYLDDEIILSHLHSKVKRKGLAGNVLEYIVSCADDLEIKMTLNAMVIRTEEGQLSEKRLLAFYRRHGFKTSAKLLSHEMYRPPQKQTFTG